MTKNQMKRYKYIMAGLGGALIFAVLLAVDLATKAWAEWYEFAYGLNQPSYFLGFIKLTYTQNRGIAFGIASDDPLVMSIIIAVTILLAILLIVAFFTIFRNNMPVRICLATVEAGAVGNIIDRLCLGYVRDFLDVRPIGFGICNIADFYIVFGVIVIAFIILFIGKNAVFPLKKSWREQARKEDEERDRMNGHSGDTHRDE